MKKAAQLLFQFLTMMNNMFPALVRFSVVFALAAFFAATVPVSPAWADAKSSNAPAIGFVKDLGKKALSSLTAKNLPEAERQSRVRTLLRENFDIQTIGRFALGTYWKTATEGQRAEYLKLFEDMIVRTYAKRFAEYSGQSFEVGESVSAGEKDTIVESKIIQKDGPAVNVEWRVRKKDGEMKVIDVIVESISMSVTQRSDFSAVIQKGGGNISALIESLKENKAAAKQAKN